MNEVRKYIFMSKYEKGKKSQNWCILPPYEQNLKFCMRRANYVATIFNSANILQVDLASPFKHVWNENLATMWSDITFPECISDMLFEVDERNDYKNDYESSDGESPKEYLPVSSDSEESDIEYYERILK